MGAVVSAPEWDPVAHLPAGRLLTPAILDGLIAAFNANGKQPLSAAQIEAIAGPPLPPPRIRWLPEQHSPRITGFAALLLALLMLAAPAAAQQNFPVPATRLFDGCPPGQVCAGSRTSTGVLISIDTTGGNGVVWHITSVGSGCTIVFETSNDNTNWVSAQFHALPAGSVTAATTTVGIFAAAATGRYTRARVSVYGSGTPAATVHLRSSYPGTGF